MFFPKIEGRITRRTLVRSAPIWGLAEVEKAPIQVFTPKSPEFLGAKCGDGLGRLPLACPSSD
jgi:hypothetical protein